MKNKIHWVVIVTDKYLESKEFYKERLSFPVERDFPEEEFTQFRLADGNNFAIYGRAQLQKLIGEKMSLASPGSTIFSFPDSLDIEKDFEELSNRGVKFFKPPTLQPWGQRTAYFQDPDGYIWELQQWATLP